MLLHGDRSCFISFISAAIASICSQFISNKWSYYISESEIKTNNDDSTLLKARHTTWNCQSTLDISISKFISNY